MHSVWTFIRAIRAEKSIVGVSDEEALPDDVELGEISIHGHLLCAATQAEINLHQTNV